MCFAPTVMEPIPSYNDRRRGGGRISVGRTSRPTRFVSQVYATFHLRRALRIPKCHDPLQNARYIVTGSAGFKGSQPKRLSSVESIRKLSGPVRNVQCQTQRRGMDNSGVGVNGLNGLTSIVIAEKAFNSPALFRGQGAALRIVGRAGQWRSTRGPNKRLTTGRESSERDDQKHRFRNKIRSANIISSKYHLHRVGTLRKTEGASAETGCG